MSDSSLGDGWWLASDGKWYPPELGSDHSSAPFGSDSPRGRRRWVWVLATVTLAALAAGGALVLSLASDRVREEVQRIDMNAVEQVSCAVIGENEAGHAAVTVTATNTTSKQSDYVVAFELLNASGERIGDGSAGLLGVPSDETLTETGYTTARYVEGSSCRVVDASRWSSR